MIVQWGFIAKNTSGNVTTSFFINYTGPNTFALVDGGKSDNTNSATYRGLSISNALPGSTNDNTQFTTQKPNIIEHWWMAIGY